MRVICPFIKRNTVERLLQKRTFRHVEVLTRFCLADFAEGVTDLSALRSLLDLGAKIRGVKNLHAKVYIFGSSRVIVSSANLTDAALFANHEFGFVSSAQDIVSKCHGYFDSMWSRAGNNLENERLSAWERLVGHCVLTGARPSMRFALPDEGYDLGLTAKPITVSACSAYCGTAGFVKFSGDERAMRSRAVVSELALRGWKHRWPHYVRVHSGVFVAGVLGNGVSLNELMAQLDSDAFATTKEHAANGFGNTDPRKAIRRQPAVELSRAGANWVEERFEQACRTFGIVPAESVEQLDWPTIPATS